ncbi:rCG61714 [Rattus norvegicus]|uniref:RCG61714 n=1 Tax=Rattus norvegicus TaxID=10116 RepID=A6HCC8_RAT|nr:rCG61714 [Rattus norvegicus]
MLAYSFIHGHPPGSCGEVLAIIFECAHILSLKESISRLNATAES